ncbi:MAG TPA: hypothetical protein VM101_01240 [Flavitalea sp.]|nr:hypothetical protein [Flavitalea sp.]
MSKTKKIARRIAIIILIIIPVSALAHFILFPQQTKSILVDFSSFTKEGRYYFNSHTHKNKIDSLKFLVEFASSRVTAFWGDKKCDPKYIYCENDEDFKKYGSPYAVPAVSHLKFGTYIVISTHSVDLDILAHEISHAEFYERIGFYNWTFKIPRWFDEGLAMQNDNRNYYSEDTLKVRSNNYKNLPDVKQMKSGKQFNGDGSPEQIMLNFMTAKHEVKLWYTEKKLDRFIQDINAGKSFEEAYRQ